MSSNPANGSPESQEVLLVGSSTAQHIHRAELDELLATIQPPVLVVPDVRGLHEVPDVVTRINRQLGLME